MRAIFTESLVPETLFNTVVYGSNEYTQSCITWKREIGINWNFGNKLFLFISSDSCHKKMLLESLTIPLTLTLLRGWWGRCEKKEGGREGGEPGTCRVLGEGSQLHARGLFRQSSLFVSKDRVGRLRNTMYCVFWR